MLACYCLQGKQLASGVIGLLTCQSHYNVSGINRTRRARLLLRHPLAQRIPTCTSECSVSVVLVSEAREWNRCMCLCDWGPECSAAGTVNEADERAAGSVSELKGAWPERSSAET